LWYAFAMTAAHGSKPTSREDAVLRRLLKMPPAPRGKKAKTPKTPAAKRPPKA
jgi:hypothetical protein